MGNVLKIKFGQAKTAKGHAASKANREQARFESTFKVTTAFDEFRFAREEHLARFGEDPAANVLADYDMARLLETVEAYKTGTDAAQGSNKEVRACRKLECKMSDDGDYQRVELTMPTEDFSPQLFKLLHDLVFGDQGIRPAAPLPLPFPMLHEPGQEETRPH
jgi:hypothetical protein